MRVHTVTEYTNFSINDCLIVQFHVLFYFRFLDFFKKSHDVIIFVCYGIISYTVMFFFILCFFFHGFWLLINNKVKQLNAFKISNWK